MPRQGSRRDKRFTRERPPDPQSPETPWRLFLALPLPDPVRELATTLITRLAADENIPARWVDPARAHVTVQFIGEVPRERAELIRLALPQVVRAHQVFQLRTADLGTFPNIRRPRVLWLGLHGPVHRLNAIHQDITTALAEMEVPHETGPLQPHITLGRVRSEPGIKISRIPDAVRGRYEELMAEGLGSMRAPIPVPVDEVVLYRSLLRAGGPTYEVAERFALAPRQSGGTPLPDSGSTASSDLATR
ncbi:MAG TPA: RNA 2',3'-cyclic phosphodiesterase [Thermomicrobiales bacterium]|jgi:2'-5' RNA ligase|nr:RNA 2',3'-cyclic phosphodiesterase [Thermomicrobiales bacterium]